MAAIDYTVCLHSEVFVTTQGGNFPHFLMGHRRYLYGGHSKTIRPDKRKLALLFDNPKIGYVNIFFAIGLISLTNAFLCEMAGKGCIDDNPFFIRADMII